MFKLRKAASSPLRSSQPQAQQAPAQKPTSPAPAKNPTSSFSQDAFTPKAARGGLAASQSRMMMLTARKSDLELQQQFVSQQRMQLANTTSSLFQQQAKLDPASPQAQQLQMRIASLQSVDKSLEMEMKQLDTQHQAVQTEIAAVQKIISKNIEQSFKTFG